MPMMGLIDETWAKFWGMNDYISMLNFFLNPHGCTTQLCLDGVETVLSLGV